MKNMKNNFHLLRRTTTFWRGGGRPNRAAPPCRRYQTPPFSKTNTNLDILFHTKHRSDLVFSKIKPKHPRSTLLENVFVNPKISFSQSFQTTKELHAYTETRLNKRERENSVTCANGEEKEVETQKLRFKASGSFFFFFYFGSDLLFLLWFGFCSCSDLLLNPKKCVRMMACVILGVSWRFSFVLKIGIFAG